jgi:hypothetical protein
MDISYSGQTKYWENFVGHPGTESDKTATSRPRHNVWGLFLPPPPPKFQGEPKLKIITYYKLFQFDAQLYIHAKSNAQEHTLH